MNNESSAALSFARDDIVLHKKTQHTYRVLGRCIIEATLADCYIYRGSDGRTWIRPVAEMEDGRFVLIESTAALLPDNAKARAYDKYMSELERLQAERPRDSLSLQAGAVLLDHFAKEFASTATGASESRGSVPDGWVLVPRKATHEMLRAGYFAPINYSALDGQSNNAVRMQLEISPIWSRMIGAAPTPPAVSNGEPTAEIRKVAKRNLRTMIEMGSADKALMLACLEELS